MLWSIVHSIYAAISAVLAVAAIVVVICVLLLDPRRLLRPLQLILQRLFRSGTDSVARSPLRWPRQEEQGEITPVSLGSSAPRRVRPGEEFTARFVAHVQGLEREVAALLSGLSPRAEHVLGVRSCRWTAGTRVTVRLAAPGLEVTPAEDAFTWEPPHQIVAFDVKVPPDAPERWTVLKFDVLIACITVARLRLDIDVSREQTLPGGPTTATAQTLAPSTAFASYTSADRPRVLDRLAELQRAGMDVFLDCLSLKPGEEWKPRLESEIASRELFLLFWSAAAKDSPWVEWEWRTALKAKGPERIDPHPLDPPHLAPPPQELAHLHFGDPLMLVRYSVDPSHPKATGQA